MAGALARLGVHVALPDMLASVTDSARTLGADGQRTAGIQVDVTSEDALAAAFAEVGRELGSPTILIKCRRDHHPAGRMVSPRTSTGTTLLVGLQLPDRSVDRDRWRLHRRLRNQSS